MAFVRKKLRRSWNGTMKTHQLVARRRVDGKVKQISCSISAMPPRLRRHYGLLSRTFSMLDARKRG